MNDTPLAPEEQVEVMERAIEEIRRAYSSGKFRVAAGDYTFHSDEDGCYVVAVRFERVGVVT